MVTDRGKRAGFHEFHEGEEVNTLNHECVSPNGSEPVSVPLHKVSVANLPDLVKPATYGEATNICIRKALRDERGERAQTDVQRNLGVP